jgi:hypothetical protein
MRWREGTPIDQIGSSPEAGIFAFAAVLGLLIGVGFVVLGSYGRQRWLAIWGGGLVVASIYYLGAFGLGYM